MYYYLTLFISAIMLSSCSGGEQEAESNQTENIVVNEQAQTRIDSTLQAFVDSGRVAGVSALIYEKGKEVYFNAVGMADDEENQRMQRNTLVQIFSMTKPITGVALMTLYDEGKFELDDPLSKYAPEFADLKVYAGEDANGNMELEPLNREITIRDITRHTAGFANSPDNPGVGSLLAEADPMNRQNTLKQMGEKLGSIPLWFQPGTQWAYGYSVDVQALVVEKISGQPFDEYVREHVLDPLQMNETRYLVPENDRERFAALYRMESDSLQKVDNESAHSFNTQTWPLKPGGYGFTSSLDDYMKFVHMLLNKGELNGNRILQEETVDLMASNQLADSVTERSWLPSKGSVGFGIDFAVRTKPPQTAEENHGKVGEFFWDGAASTLFWVDPEHQLGAVFFVQIVPFQGALHKDFRDAVYGIAQIPQ